MRYKLDILNAQRIYFSVLYEQTEDCAENPEELFEDSN